MSDEEPEVRLKLRKVGENEESLSKLWQEMWTSALRLLSLKKVKVRPVISIVKSKVAIHLWKIVIMANKGE